MINKNRLRLRIIVPAFPFLNIYSNFAKKTTALGPVYVGTAVNKLAKWDVEIIDENNCKHKLCPKDKNGYPDHIKLQKERPADVVGFYGSLSSTVPRIFKLAKLYKKLGVKTIAGGKHIEFMPKEALGNNIDVAVIGEGEETAKELLQAWQEDRGIETVKGIAYLKDNVLLRTEKRPLNEDLNSLVFPDFNLVRYANIKIYPVSRTRGCNMNCEFCAVKDKARFACAKTALNVISYLTETRKARKFFETSDHFAADREGTIKFCILLADYQKRKKVKLQMTVQARLSDAQFPELLAVMQKAGINNVCIGYESPIDKELINMKKGYLSKDMIKWTEIYHKYDFYIHGMFLFGYPSKRNMPCISIDEKAKRFQRFIRKAKIDTIQVLMPVPLPGTSLRDRLDNEGRLYHGINWEYYDGQFPLFKPDGCSPEKLQITSVKIMNKFYSFRHFWRLVISILFDFPIFVFPAAFTLFSFKIKYLVATFNFWNKRFFRNQRLCFGGYLVARNWFKNFRKGKFSQRLKEAKQEIKKLNH